MNPKTSVPEKSITAFIVNSCGYAGEVVNEGIASFATDYEDDKTRYFKVRKVKKVMVADDDPATVDVVTLMLETAGYKVYATANRQTFADITRVCPDVILLDILMYGANGHDICKKLKNQKSTKHIPIIIISANIHADEISILACADDFINKPFDMHKLLQKVAIYI